MDNKNDVKIKNFVCSEHGPQKPIVIPKCPLCATPSKQEKECCSQCFLPERDGDTFHSSAAGYALPEGCKDEDCECHSTQNSESDFKARCEHGVHGEDCHKCFPSAPSPSLQELIEKKLGTFREKFVFEGWRGENAIEVVGRQPAAPVLDFLQSAITESHRAGRDEREVEITQALDKVWAEEDKRGNSFEEGRRAERERANRILTEEIAQAHKDGSPTSRLTSAYMRLSQDH